MAYNKIMPAPLLQTKLFIPQLRPSLIPRPRLINRLNEGLAGKLTLVSAPPGFGKTTLISSWIQQLERPSAWLSLGKEDNEISRFLLYLIAAWQKIDEDAGEKALSLLQSSPMLGEVTALRSLAAYEGGKLTQSKELAAIALDLLPAENKTIRSVALLVRGMAHMWSDDDILGQYAYRLISR
jgi:ATP/maltotriose-dependent transcriptional regulator MalT